MRKGEGSRDIAYSSSSSSERERECVCVCVCVRERERTIIFSVLQGDSVKRYSILLQYRMFQIYPLRGVVVTD